MLRKKNVYLVGVDGGGSKTIAVVSDAQGHLLGKGYALGSNYVRIGIDKAVEHIKYAIDTAMEQAGLKAKDIDFIQYALASADRQEDFDILIPALSRLPFQRFNVVCDTIGGLRSGSPSNTGVVLLCGFGTNAAGRNKQGTLKQVGGFGSFYGDYAGGHWLAHRTFQAAIRSWEGREIPSVLTEKVPYFHGFSNMQNMLDDYLNKGNNRIPHELAIVVHDAASEGDSLAIQLLEDMGRELGLSALAVIHQMDGFGEEEIPVVLVGSVLQKGKSPYLLSVLEQTVKSKVANAVICIPEVEPVIGSVLLAMDQLEIDIDEEMIQNLRNM